MKMENKIIENHKIETVEYDMHVDGQILKEGNYFHRRATFRNGGQLGCN